MFHTSSYQSEPINLFIILIIIVFFILLLIFNFYFFYIFYILLNIIIKIIEWDKPRDTSGVNPSRAHHLHLGNCFHVYFYYYSTFIVSLLLLLLLFIFLLALSFQICSHRHYPYSCIS